MIIKWNLNLNTAPIDEILFTDQGFAKKTKQSYSSEYRWYLCDAGGDIPFCTCCEIDSHEMSLIYPKKWCYKKDILAEKQ